MTESTQEAATDTEQAPASTRVPNVSPGAVSGLDHTVIGSNAQDAEDFNAAMAGDDMPDGAEQRLAWVSAASTREQAEARAAEVWEANEDPDIEEALAERLRSSVYGTPLSVPEGLDAEGQLAWIAAAEDPEEQERRITAVEELAFEGEEDPDEGLLGALGWSRSGAGWTKTGTAAPVVTTQDGEAVETTGEAADEGTEEVTQPGDALPDPSGQGRDPLPEES